MTSHTIRNLTAREAADRGVVGLPLTGRVDAPATQITAQFVLQSYFSTSLGPQAINRQPLGEGVIAAQSLSPALAPLEANVSGYAIGLHPSSDTPIAVQFKKGEMQDAPIYVLKPGQVIRPFGQPGGRAGRFSGFTYGLPYGWLGGGAANILVFRTPDSSVDWLDRSEVIFHRVRLPILQPADVPAAVQYNWPTRFPWLKAARGTNSLSQGGQPVLTVHPTQVFMSLRGDLAAPATMRVYFIGSDAFGENANGAIDLTDVRGYDVVWGTWTSIASANFATQYQVQPLYDIVPRLGANGGGVFLVDASGVGSLNGLYVDIVRYGVL